MLKELLKALWGIRDAIGGKKENQSSDKENQSSDGKVFGFYFPDAIGALLEPEQGAEQVGGISEGMIPSEPDESEPSELTPVIFKNIDDVIEHYSEYAGRFHTDEQTQTVFYSLYKNNNLEATKCAFTIALTKGNAGVQMGQMVVTEIPEGYDVKFKQGRFEGYYYLNLSLGNHGK